MDQMIFNIPSSVSQSRGDFIVSESNNMAYQYLVKRNDIWGVAPYNNILILSGPEFSGKSHLASIWQNDNNALNVKVQNNMYNLSDRNVLCEDIENIKNLTALLDFLNERIASDKLTLLTCNAKEMSFKLADLSSRIQAINKVSIDDPDEALKQINVY